MDRHENNLLCKIDDDNGLSSNSLRSISVPNLFKLEKYQQKEENHLSLGSRSRSFSHIEEIYNHLVYII